MVPVCMYVCVCVWVKESRWVMGSSCSVPLPLVSLSRARAPTRSNTCGENSSETSASQNERVGSKMPTASLREGVPVRVSV